LVVSSIKWPAHDCFRVPSGLNARKFLMIFLSAEWLDKGELARNWALIAE